MCSRSYCPRGRAFRTFAARRALPCPPFSGLFQRICSASGYGLVLRRAGLFGSFCACLAPCPTSSACGFIWELLRVVARLAPVLRLAGCLFRGFCALSDALPQFFGLWAFFRDLCGLCPPTLPVARFRAYAAAYWRCMSGLPAPSVFEPVSASFSGVGARMAAAQRKAPALCVWGASELRSGEGGSQRAAACRASPKTLEKAVLRLFYLRNCPFCQRAFRYISSSANLGFRISE